MSINLLSTYYMAGTRGKIRTKTNTVLTPKRFTWKTQVTRR